jgi:long-chain acyl-CoA synthetase
MDYRACPNLVAMLLDRAATFGEKPALWGKRGDQWVALTYRDLARQVAQLAAGLQALGIGSGDRVALVAENRPEWIVADYAIMAAGAITVPAYTTNTVADNRHIFGNAGVKGVIASTRALAERAFAASLETPTCGFLIAIERPDVTQNVGVQVLAWEDMLAPRDPAPIAEIAGRLKRTDLACIIHTSGTGGLPKGVALSHGAILSNCLGAYDLLVELGLSDEVFLSFLPLSHSYEHTCVGAFALSIGAQTYFAESVEALPRNMAETRPTIMTAVPRLYETMHQRILAGLKREKPLKQNLFFRTVALGRKRYEAPGSMTLVERLLDRLLDILVRAKVSTRFGGRLKAFVSGGAPLNYEIALFFTALGVRLLQGYGQTEAAPVVACNRPFRAKLDTVGPPLTDVEVRIAEDGEILVRGELVMAGYWNDEAASADAIKDGWLHTGDIGLIDADGYIKITDRKKDFIKNTGGDMVAPARIEGLLALQAEIAQAMVYGDRKPHLVAVIVPHPEAIEAAAKANGVSPDLASLTNDKALRATVDAAIARVNAQLQGHERIRRFVVAREPFAIANEMMTPTLKIKRHKIREAYGAQLEALYQ